MLGIRVIPCLLLNNNRLVKTVQFKNPEYIGDPVNAIKIYNEKEVDELIFLDITATVEHRAPPFDNINNITNECFMPVTYGGGISKIEDMRKIFHSGIEKISINSFSVKDPEFVTSAAKEFGSQSIIISIDVKKDFFGRYYVYTNSGTQKIPLDPVQHAINMEQRGAGEILLTSIDQEGSMGGYDLVLIRRVSESISIPLIAHGGAGSIEHFRQAVDAGASAVAAGSMVVYQGKNKGILINFPSPDELQHFYQRHA